jgi:hypothetical protein
VDAMGCENTAIDSIFIDDCVGVIRLEKDRLNLVVFPNPFGSSVAMEYELQKPEMISLIIYNKQGKQVYQTQENQPPGKQQLNWSAEGFAEGVYYYRLQVGNQVVNGKLVKVR